MGKIEETCKSYKNIIQIYLSGKNRKRKLANFISTELRKYVQHFIKEEEKYSDATETYTDPTGLLPEAENEGNSDSCDSGHTITDNSTSSELALTDDASDSERTVTDDDSNSYDSII